MRIYFEMGSLLVGFGLYRFIANGATLTKRDILMVPICISIWPALLLLCIDAVSSRIADTRSTLDS